ncbi:MAG: hypothetical protein QOI67_79 [Gaiellaceae bacterium]|jgi:hypothetical protein|nr:hypothetical protein [Gaiellaceae bacterium]
MDALRLDGNAAAGVLREVFGSEMTTAVGTCGSCGAVDLVGAVHVYVAAGVVLRCPSCEAVLMRIVESESRFWIDLTGLRSIELQR